MTVSNEPVTLVATFRAHTGASDEVRRMITTYAQTVRAEPGCVFFDVFTHADDESAFVVYERYADRAAFDHHLATEAGQEFNRQLTPLVEGGGSELLFLRSAED